MWFILAADILLVLSPGVHPDAFSPLYDELTSQHNVDVMRPSCADSPSALVTRLRERATDNSVIVSHGMSSWVALRALPEHHHFTLAPLLEPPRSPAFQQLLSQDDWSEPLHFSHLTAQEALGLPRGICMPRAFAEPTELPKSVTVWAAIGLRDDAAPPEQVLPQLNAWSAEVERIGLSSFHDADVNHWSILRSPDTLRLLMEAL